VEALAPAVSPDAESLLHAMVAHAVDALARRYVVAGDEHVYDDRAVVEALDGLATGDAAAIVAAGVSDAAPDTDTDAAAAAFARLPALALAADIGAVTRARQVTVAEALGLVEAFEAAVGAADFRAALDRRDLGSRWGRWQARRLKDDMADLRRQAALAAASGPGSLAEGPAAAMAAWLAAPAAAAARARYQRLMALLADPEADVLCVAALAVRALADLTDHA
jgi:NAD-specific glutamate dehydrogenase